ncbi:MAG TPA: hypothetical protein PKC13_17700, partial [Blastocatellia bacterium]|nr:hypothetical protein [Blastocatellia bacterium]
MYRLDTHESAPPAVAGGKRNNRFHSPLLVLLILLFASIAAFAQQTETIEKKVSNPIGVADDERRSQRQTKPEQITIVAQTAPDKSDEVVIYSEKKEVQGDVYILTGKVQITYTDILVIADRATFNTTTNDLLAEGNVYFEQQGQRFTGERL